MKGKSKQKAIFIEIAKNLNRMKPAARKQTFSFFQAKPINTQNATSGISTQVQTKQNSVPCKRKISLSHQPVKTYQNPGMNQEFLYMRKENHLNTHYNERKNKLKEITKENKQIYKRLNSQKSLYSSIQLNKSFEINNGISKRLSQSKLSQRSSSSRVSQRSQLSSKKGQRTKDVKHKPKIEIKTTNINSVPNTDLRMFKGLFSANTEKARSNVERKEDRTAFSVNSHRRNEIYTRSQKRDTRNTLQPVNENQKASGMGSLLHRIEEQMKPSNDKKGSKRQSGYMRPTKLAF